MIARHPERLHVVPHPEAAIDIDTPPAAECPAPANLNSFGIPTGAGIPQGRPAPKLVQYRPTATHRPRLESQEHISLARLLATTALILVPLGVRGADPARFSLEQILSAPFAADIVASPTGRAFAWVSNAKGRRNVWLAEARSDAGRFEARALTHYAADDGLDVSELAFVSNEDELLYVLGGDAEYPDKPAANPAQIPTGVEHEVFLVDFRGHAPVKLGTGHSPVASPDGKLILFIQKGKVYSAPARHGGKPELLFDTRGNVGSLRFSPDSHRLAFVCTREDHSFVGLYSVADHALRWLDASLAFDIEPRWSPDGTRIAFLRLPATPDEVGLIAHRTGAPWSIRVANAADGRVAEIYRAPKGVGSVFHALGSEQQLYWSGNDSIVFPAENDGWLHFYSVPATGGAARPLTPGPFEIEYASASSDGQRIVYAANAGDIDRRHLWQLEPASGRIEQLTNGGGIETQPVMLADGKSIALLSSNARLPAHAAVLVPGQAARGSYGRRVAARIFRPPRWSRRNRSICRNARAFRPTASCLCPRVTPRSAIPP